MSRLASKSADPGDLLTCFDSSTCQPGEPGPHINEIINSSTTKAQTMVNAAVQSIPSLEGGKDNAKRIAEAIDYVNNQIPFNGSCTSMAPNAKLANASDKNEAQIPSELITKCVATLLMIQAFKTERTFNFFHLLLRKQRPARAGLPLLRLRNVRSNASHRRMWPKH